MRTSDRSQGRAMRPESRARPSVPAFGARLCSATLWGGVLGAMALGCLVVGGCGREAPPPEGRSAVPVEVLVVTPDSLSETTVLTGLLKAYRSVDIVSEVSGGITSIRRDLGDRVSGGEILATVDKKVPRETLNQAEAALMAARAGYEVARVDFQRDSTLHTTGASSPSIYEKSRLAMTAAQADLRSARAGRELAARHLEDTDIRAPFDGYVSRRACEIGGYVAPGVAVFRVVDIDSLRLRLGVSQADVARLRPGANVHISIDALGGRSFSGRVRAISPEADEMTRTFAVDVVLANPAGQPLRDGLVVRATLALDTRRNVLAVPREAVLRQSGGGFVFVVEDSVAHRREVRLGPMINDHYVVEGGLIPGDHVVSVGAQNLRDGSRVQVETVHTRRSWRREHTS